MRNMNLIFCAIVVILDFVVPGEGAAVLADISINKYVKKDIDIDKKISKPDLPELPIEKPKKLPVYYSLTLNKYPYEVDSYEKISKPKYEVPSKSLSIESSHKISKNIDIGGIGKKLDFKKDLLDDKLDFKKDLIDKKLDFKKGLFDKSSSYGKSSESYEYDSGYHKKGGLIDKKLDFKKDLLDDKLEFKKDLIDKKLDFKKGLFDKSSSHSKSSESYEYESGNYQKGGLIDNKLDYKKDLIDKKLDYKKDLIDGIGKSGESYEYKSDYYNIDKPSLEKGGLIDKKLDFKKDLIHKKLDFEKDLIDKKLDFKKNLFDKSSKFSVEKSYESNSKCGGGSLDIGDILKKKADFKGGILDKLDHGINKDLSIEISHKFSTHGSDGKYSKPNLY